MKTSMKLLAAAALSAAAFAAQAQVGVSISIGQPGFYGQIDLGNAPPPQLVYAQPVFVSPIPNPPPAIYLHVPAGYESHWGRYCRQYNACGRPVFFVRDSWYQQVYVPHYRDHYDPVGHRWNDAPRGPAGHMPPPPPPHGHDDRGRDDHGRDDHARDDHGHPQDHDHDHDDRDHHNN